MIKDKIKLMKHKSRAHDLAMNLPSRMLNTFDTARALLLGDKTYFPEKSATNKDDSTSQRKSSKRNSETDAASIATSAAAASTTSFRSRPTLSVWKIISNNLHRYCRRLSIKIYRLSESIPVIQPSSSMKLLWDFLNMLAIIVSLFGLPLTVIFDFSYQKVIPKYILWIIPNVLIIDVIVNLNTGFFDKGQVVNRHSKVI